MGKHCSQDVHCPPFSFLIRPVNSVTRNFTLPSRALFCNYDNFYPLKQKVNWNYIFILESVGGEEAGKKAFKKRKMIFNTF